MIPCNVFQSSQQSSQPEVGSLFSLKPCKREVHNFTFELCLDLRKTSPEVIQAVYVQLKTVNTITSQNLWPRINSSK